jgi:hypothetical protein
MLKEHVLKLTNSVHDLTYFLFMRNGNTPTEDDVLCRLTGELYSLAESLEEDQE